MARVGANDAWIPPAGSKEWARRVRDCADWSDHSDGIVKGWAVSWQMEKAEREAGSETLGLHAKRCSYIASGLSMPRSAREPTSSRRATAAVASKNVLRAGSSSVRMWWRW